jgi:hypothetical protein
MGVENKGENMVSKIASGFMSITLGTLFGIFKGLGGVVGLAPVGTKAYGGMKRRASA